MAAARLVAGAGSAGSAGTRAVAVTGSAVAARPGSASACGPRGVGRLLSLQAMSTTGGQEKVNCRAGPYPYHAEPRAMPRP